MRISSPRLLPFAVIGLGFVTLLLSTRFEGGFVKGLFQGATLALMVGGAYLVSALILQPADGGAMWRPSEDARRDDPR